MLINSVSFPYPVIGLNDDFVDSKYESEIEIAPTESTMNFIVKHGLKNKTLESLISSKKASFCVEINCPSTFYRNSFLSSEPTQRFEISQSLLRGRFSIVFYISANEDIKDYLNEDFNPDYKDRTFEINGGDVIAYGGSTSFTAIKDWNALKSLKTFMTISGGSETNYMEIILGTDKINVLLPDEEYKKYKDIIVYEDVPPIIHSSIVYPALIYALNIISVDQEGQKDKEWFKFLQLKKDNDPTLKLFDWKEGEDEISRFAQELLGKPVKRMIEDLRMKKTQESEPSDD